MRTLTLVVLVVAVAASGCNWLTPLVFVGEHKKEVTAEFDKLPGSRVAVLVWTDPAVLFDYPYARFELASYVTEKLTTEFGSRNQRIDLVNAREVEDFVRRDPGVAVDPRTVGRQFSADFVLYLEVIAFQIRDPRQPQFLQGRIGASVAVYDIRPGAGAADRYELAPVEAVYPEGQPVVLSATNAPLVREMTYRTFADMVARKFYNYTVEIR